VSGTKGKVPESETQVVRAHTVNDWGKHSSRTLLLIGCKDVKEDVAFYTKRMN
jgi:hypothetical protein